MKVTSDNQQPDMFGVQAFFGKELMADGEHNALPLIYDKIVSIFIEQFGKKIAESIKDKLDEEQIKKLVEYALANKIVELKSKPTVIRQ